MASQPLFNVNGEYNPVRDRVFLSPSLPQSRGDQLPPAIGRMGVSALNVRSSPENASAAMVMRDMPAKDSIIDNQPSKSRNAKKVRFLKAAKPIAPIYKQKKDAYFLYLVNEVRYEKFANDAQALSPSFIKRSSMETLWYKTLRNHYANWKGQSLGSLSRKKALVQANKQAAGYEGFDAKSYWELQNMVHGMEGMSVDKEADPKFAHFRAMERARRARKAELRLAAKSDKVKAVAQDTTMEH
ncbi:hypothetical protein BKA65DRAFT_478817 [Rhexocercosporidium sp. MPI-PUGE-AT-0058]|nr:hypothetical protein BKA65DRAFT_478817 [Rhexocercosporidium sp. MPI-PUGE-AT-0058]